MLPIGPHPDGGIMRRQKHGIPGNRPARSLGLYHSPIALPRFRRTTVHALLLESSCCAAPFPRPHSDTPRSGCETPRLDMTLPPSQSETPRVLKRHPTRVSNRDPFNHPCEPPTEPPTTTTVLDALPPTLRLARPAPSELMSGIQAALAAGWTSENLIMYLSRNPHGVRRPERVLLHRLAQLPNPLTHHAPIPWCGESEDPRSRTITVDLADGTVAADFCPRCSPQAQHSSRNH